MLAATPEGLIGLGPSAAVEIAFDARLADKQRIVEALARGATPESLAEIAASETDDAAELLDRLEQAGALSPEPSAPPPARGSSLIAALLSLIETGELPGLVWTADEALVVPSGLDESQCRRLLRAFIAGIEPRERRVGYGYAAHWRAPTVWGDVPEEERLDAALEATDLPPSAIGVVGLDGSSLASLDPEELAAVGVERSHRLGPITSTRRARLDFGPPELHLVSARMATPNLAHPEPPVVGLSGKGTGPSPEAAETIARGEAAERYAIGDVTGHRIVRASEAELDGAVPADLLLRHNARQHARPAITQPYDPGERYLWTPATASSGARRWVLAEAVFNPFRDFERRGAVIRASSSGAAAHRTLAEARRRAFCELIERDAFMWTWIQRLSRERIATASLPPQIRARTVELARAGYEADCVNLTLETEPVILGVIRDEELLAVGACCAPEPARAAAKALDEATLVLSLAQRSEPIDPLDVLTPRDHVRLYRDPAVVAEASFLCASNEEIDLRDVNSAEAPLDELLAPIGEPLTVDLSSPAIKPLHAARALVPGLIPISFGWDREPLGMPLLARPRTAADGRLLGSQLDLTTAGPLTPHPFA
jgi:ribosomal protein S12 methylthiotransferase accessory factor